MRSSFVSLVAVLMLAIGCRSTPADSDLIELQRARAGGLDVVLLSTDGNVTHGKDTVTVEFRRGDQLVDVGMVKAAATMAMAGMPPMLGSVFLERGDMPGRYMADTDLSMSGGWQLKLEWDGPAGKGSASFQATVD